VEENGGGIYEVMWRGREKSSRMVTIEGVENKMKFKMTVISGSRIR
jgi:hypothetical protein